MPTVTIIAGPNGAGKTTFAREYLPLYVRCSEFLNADLIAAGVSPFDPPRGAILAARVLLDRLRELASEGRDFAFETTLSGRTYASILREMKAAGYSVQLFYLWLPDVELAIQRVAQRVIQGGHHVPEDDIRRRFAASLRNLFELYLPILDEWYLFDSSTVPRLVAATVAGASIVLDPKMHAAIMVASRRTSHD